MTEIAAAAAGATFKDRKVGLVIFGIFQILLGLLCALFLPLMILGALADKNTSANMMIPGMLFYAFLAAWFITMGIGSVMALRWARALSLLFSWLWLICGISALLFMALLMPDMFAQMNKSGQLPPETIAIMKAVMFAFMSVIYLVLPGVFGFFYQSRHVKATCEARDAKERWTDRCPLPVLALSLVFGFWTASMVLMGFYNWALPFFGTILSGPAGAAVTILLMALMGYVSWGTWRLRIAAWWCAVLSSLIWVASSIVTFARVDLMQLYEKMNFAADQLDLIKQTGLPQNQSMTWFISAWFLGFLAYLLYTKKYFQGEPQNTRKSTEEA